MQIRTNRSQGHCSNLSKYDGTCIRNLKDYFSKHFPFVYMCECTEFRKKKVLVRNFQLTVLRTPPGSSAMRAAAPRTLFILFRRPPLSTQCWRGYFLSAPRFCTIRGARTLKSSGPSVGGETKTPHSTTISFVRAVVVGACAFILQRRGSQCGALCSYRRSCNSTQGPPSK